MRDPALRAGSTSTSSASGRFAATLDAERPSFARIKIDGVLESTLSVVVTYDPGRGGPGRARPARIADTGLYSTCLAIQNLWLAATAEELGVGWVSFYREPSLAACSASRPGPAGGLALRRPGHPPRGDPDLERARLAAAPPPVRSDPPAAGRHRGAEPSGGVLPPGASRYGPAGVSSRNAADLSPPTGLRSVLPGSRYGCER